MGYEVRHIYDRLPECVKDVLGWGLRCFPRHQWRPTREEKRHYELLLQTEFASAEVLQDLQFRKLRRLLDHASRHVPYYRNLFRDISLNPADITNLAALRQLPLLSKDMIRSAPDDFLSDTIKDRTSLVQIATGGSTGTPMRYYFDRHMVGVRRATWWRWSKFAGVDLYSDRMVYCGGAPTRWIYPPEDFRGIVNYERNNLLLSSAAMSDKVLDRYIQDMLRFRGDYVRGYASGTYMLARRVLEKGMTIPMKAVLTSSDALFPQYRGVIEEAFSCQVFDHYGQNEDVLTATECGEGQGFHINVENCIAEAVDELGAPVDDGEGRLVSTHLENYAMPLIRYEVGDVGSLDSRWEACGCGRSHQKIRRLQGRYGEIIVTPDGRRIGGGSMSLPMKTMLSSVKGCQFIQERVGFLRAKVLPTTNWHDAVHRRELEANLRKQLGDVIEIEIDVVDTIPARENGKYQFIVSRI